VCKALVSQIHFSELIHLNDSLNQFTLQAQTKCFLVIQMAHKTKNKLTEMERVIKEAQFR